MRESIRPSRTERFRGKSAIVAGASWNTIGGSIAYLLAAEGARVVLNADDGTGIEATFDHIVAAGGDAVPVVGDAAEEKTWQNLVDRACAWKDGIDALVYTPAETTLAFVTSLSSDEWDRCFAVTVRGAWLAAKAAIPKMLDGSAIVFVSSVNAQKTSPGFGAYGPAKAALEALARSLALEHGRDGIRVNVIAPGQVESAESACALPDDEDLASRSCYARNAYGTLEEVASCALFLLSPEASFVTGSVLVADGGLTILSPEALIRPSFRARWSSS